MNIPPKILASLEHVRLFHPEIDRVVFFTDGKWAYMTTDYKVPAFSKQIDVSILEDAVYDVTYLPCVFEMNLD